MSATPPEQFELPPTPQQAAAASMKENATSAAGDMIWRKIRRELYRHLPKLLHPLIPGHRRSLAGEAKHQTKRWLWGLVWTAMFFLVFAALAGFVLLLVVGIIAWALLM